MAIFSKSKKKQTTATSPQQQSPPVFSSLSGPLHRPHGKESQPDLGRLHQTQNRRPNTSHGYGSSPPQGWATSPAYQPIYVTQNYLIAPPLPRRPSKSTGAISKLSMGSVSNLLAGNDPNCPVAKIINDGLPTWHRQGTQYLNQGAALCDLITSKFDAVITQIDGEIFSGNETDLVVRHEQAHPVWQQERAYTGPEHVKGKSKGMVNNSVSSALVSTNYFAKVNLYANSRLPPDLPPLKLYIPTFPLLCLAAQYSERVYSKPAGQEKDTHVDSDWRLGTKAMVIKSVPMDDMNTIVFAIRGTQTFMDWAVNLNSAPASPDGFLDDPGNFCHAGFLTVAKKMVKPVAARLRNLLQEDPSRSKCSLLITGHSAGGAVAALLYSHMLSTSREAESELNILTGCFKRIHCVSFGAPPVSLLPLTKPNNPALRKSIFLSFVNEGDPVPRADKAYVRSLLDLYSTPAPSQSNALMAPRQPFVYSSGGKSSSSLTLNKVRPTPKQSNSYPPPPPAPVWKVPDATLSNAGRLVLLRSVERYENQPSKKKQIHERMNDGVVAQMITDELLRGVIWGDPVCHMMRLYARRIEVLATNAVMGRS